MSSTLNNSEGNTSENSTKDKTSILHVHNMLNIDKENFGHSIEKNVARSLRPALRTTNGNQIMTSETPLRKQIRFNLSRGSGVDTSENMTPTPPPKDFKRFGNRKTLRNARCMSTIVTEKERLMLEDQPVNSPKAPQGFVKSMCKFYVDNFSTTTKKLNRSNSFSGPESSSAESSPKTQQEESRRGSFRLFRSNSWSSRKKKNPEVLPVTEGGQAPQLSPNNEAIIEAQRCSPSSYSTKSQDSGFSDVPQVAGDQLRTSASQLIQNQRLQFLRSSMEVKEDDKDPNLTQMPQADVSKLRPTSTNSGNSKQIVTQSLDNIASLQVGLRMKRALAEDDLKQPLPAPTNGALNLLRPQVNTKDKIRPKSFIDSVNYLDSIIEENDTKGPLFSTPVRSSFRRHPMQLEEAKTPMKREGKTSRLRELKTKGRRWSAAVDYSGFHGNVIEPRELPDNVDHSLVAVWSQFVNYEPTLQTLSSHVTPPINPSTSSRQVFHQPAGQLTSEVVSVDDHLSLGQLSATQLSYDAADYCGGNSNLSQLRNSSLRIMDRNETLLLNGNESVSNNHQLQCNTSPLEEAIIEMEQPSLIQTPPNPKSRKPSSSSKVNTSPVCEWWKDLHGWCEPECMTYLQSKPILQQTTPMSTGSPASSACNHSNNSSEISEDYFTKEIHSNIVQIMKQLQIGSKSINVTFTSIDKHLSSKNLAHLGKSVQLLLNQVQKYVYDYNMGKMGNAEESEKDFLSDSFKNYEWNFPGLRKNLPANMEEEIKSLDQDGMKELVLLQQRTVLQTVDRLKLCAHRSQYTPNQPLKEMHGILQQLKGAFNSLVEKMLAKELRPLVREIDHPSSEVGIRSALHSVIALGNEAGMGNSSSQAGNATCVLLAKEGCVKALLKQCHHSLQRTSEIRVLALRGLSAICCVAQCIREFEKSDGLRILEELLCSRGSLIEDRIEAAGVLAQITSPWISDNHKINQLDNYVYNMVNALTGLSRLNGGEETFLLVTAALANLTFMSPLSSAAMKRCGTPEALVKAVKRSPFTTLFAKDQVVTVLANMAANANCRHDIEAIDGVGFLLSMLETSLNGTNSKSELSAAERVQKKSAIALSRLCNSSKVCRDLIRLSGVDRLVELCQNPSERNYSDAVLVSCLAVLRRLNANLEQSEELQSILHQLKALNLIRTNLVDSFMEYSTKQESLV